MGPWPGYAHGTNHDNLVVFFKPEGHISVRLVEILD